MATARQCVFADPSVWQQASPAGGVRRKDQVPAVYPAKSLEPSVPGSA